MKEERSMTAILNSLVTVLGAWLVVSPYLLGTRGVALAIAIAAGAIALVLSIVAIKQAHARLRALCPGNRACTVGHCRLDCGLGGRFERDHRRCACCGPLVRRNTFRPYLRGCVVLRSRGSAYGGRSEPAHERRYHPHEGFAVAVDAVDGLYQARGGLESSHDGSLRLD